MLRGAALAEALGAPSFDAQRGAACVGDGRR